MLFLVFVFVTFLQYFCVELLSVGQIEDDPIIMEVSNGPNYGSPLFLTPYIKNGQIDIGQAASMVQPLKENVSSYAGYLTVNDNYNSNMFFWYFPAENDPDKAPIVVWLQGGPGSSSMIGLFEENGPFYVKLHKGLKMRDVYWSQALHVIYIDNPVGTGFSFTDKEEGYCIDENCVGENLYEAITQFFTLFPDLQKNDFFVTGESYAGKYVPALSHVIHTKNPTAKLKINFKGMAIGNGLCDPLYQSDYSDYLYELGLVDDNDKVQFTQAYKNIVNLINQKKWNEALQAFDGIIMGLLTNQTIFNKVTGFVNYYNYLHDKKDTPYGNLNDYIAKDILRRSIHAGNLTFHNYSKVFEKLENDFMQSVLPWVSEIANNYRVLFYSGQLDIIIPYRFTVNLLQNLNWCGSQEYKTAKRNIWLVNGEVAGFSKLATSSKCAGSLTEVLVRNAGHLVPEDQPHWAMDLIVKFTNNKPL